MSEQHEGPWLDDTMGATTVWRNGAEKKGHFRAVEMTAEYANALEAQLAEALSQRQAAVEELALQRKQLRNAWAKLKCRCIFNDEDEKTAEDSHCPYHGWQQRDPDGWDPVGDLEEKVQAAVEEAERLRGESDAFANTIRLLVAENLTERIPYTLRLERELAAANQDARSMRQRLQRMADEVDAENDYAFVVERLGDLLHNAIVAADARLASQPPAEAEGA